MSIIETVTLFRFTVALAAMASARVALVITCLTTPGVMNGLAITIENSVGVSLSFQEKAPLLPRSTFFVQEREALGDPRIAGQLIWVSQGGVSYRPGRRFSTRPGPTEEVLYSGGRFATADGRPFVRQSEKIWRI